MMSATANMWKVSVVETLIEHLDLWLFKQDADQKNFLPVKVKVGYFIRIYGKPVTIH